MNSSGWIDTLESVLAGLPSHLPTIIGAILLVALGWITAKLLAMVVRTMSDRAFRRLQGEQALAIALETSGIRGFALKLIGSLVFWIVILLFFVAAVEILGLPILTNLFGRVAAYLPNLVAAAALVIVGLVGGRMVHGAAKKGAVLMRLEPQARILAGFAHALVLTIAGVMALEQLGVQGRFLELVLGLTLGSVLAAGSLAFALGARQAVANIVAVRYVAQLCQVGQEIEIDGIRGSIVQIASTAVIIESKEGRVIIPAARFHESYPLLVKVS